MNEQKGELSKESDTRIGGESYYLCQPGEPPFFVAHHKNFMIKCVLLESILC